MIFHYLSLLLESKVLDIIFGTLFFEVFLITLGWVYFLTIHFFHDNFNISLFYQESSPQYSGIKSVGLDGVQSERINRYHGFPSLTFEKLAESLYNDYQIKTNKDKTKCKSIFNSLDSFPFGLTSKGYDATQKDGYRGRVLNHPDLVNLQALDGVLFNLKYLILARNITVSHFTPFLSLIHSFIHSKLPFLFCLEDLLTILMNSFVEKKWIYCILKQHFEQFLVIKLSLLILNMFVVIQSHFFLLCRLSCNFLRRKVKWVIALKSLSLTFSHSHLHSIGSQVLKRNLEVFEEEHKQRRREPYTFPSSLCSGVTQYGCYKKVQSLLSHCLFIY